MSAIRTKLLHRHLATAGAKISAVASTVTSAAGRSYPWNSQLRELANKSLFSDALYIYLQMLRSGATPNAFTFPFALKSSAVLSLPFVGKQLHCQSIRTGCLAEPFVQTALISMYSKCGLVDVARKVFDENPKSRELTVCYNALIAGYSLNMRVKDTVLLLCEMRELEVPINGVTMLGVVPVCGVPGNLGLGVCVHCFCMKLGLNLDLSVGNGLLSMYLRCGEINSARKLFDEIPGKGLITWNAMINGYSQNGLANDVLELYREMGSSGIHPDPVTLVGVLSSCAHLGAQGIGKQLHCQIIRTGCLSESFVRTSLLSMYSKCGFVDVARQVFDENPQSKELTSCYNALISGYSMNLRLKDAVFLFCEMSELRVPIDGVTMLGLVPVCGILGNLGLGICVHCYCVKLSLNFDWAVGNGLLSMYLRCGEIISGRKLFDEMPRKRLVTWNAIINGYAQNGLANDVLELYREMGSSGIHPNPLTLVGVLSSCANLGAHEVGMEVEMQTHARGFMLDPFLNSGLINMYARCGNLVKAREIFDGLSANNLVSWTAIIGSYGMHGEGEIAVELFDDMIKSGTRPDGRVFVNVLSACSHAGLTDKGLHYFDAMEHKYKLHPGPEHYSCMVDLLGRAGRLEEAHRLIKSMKAEPDDAVWGALLGACKIHRNVELAELAFERVIELEPTNIGYYVLLSNIYKDAGNSEGILRIRRMMRERKLKKDPGCSYVEFMGKVHIFLSGDKSHPQSKQIYKFLDELESEMKELDSLTTEGEKNIISDEEPKNIWRLSLVHEDS
ncbi:Putative pentatricopeptide repeat-containing protein At3g11460, mitochondrial [Linum perenne]